MPIEEEGRKWDALWHLPPDSIDLVNQVYRRLDKNISYCGPSETQLPLAVTGERPIVQ